MTPAPGGPATPSTPSASATTPDASSAVRPNTTVESPVDYCEGYYSGRSNGGDDSGWMHVTPKGCMLIRERFLLRPDHSVREMRDDGVVEGTWEGNRFYFSMTLPPYSWTEGKDVVWRVELEQEASDN